MSIQYRKRIAVGPLRFNITKKGLSSVSMKLGPVTRTVWSQSGKKSTYVNGPGGTYGRY